MKADKKSKGKKTGGGTGSRKAKRQKPAGISEMQSISDLAESEILRDSQTLGLTSVSRSFAPQGMEHNPCHPCTMCCEYVTVELDRPRSKTDYDALMWHLLHEDTNVFIDHDGDWYVEFQSRCTALNESGECSIYDERPKVCRDHDRENCEASGGSPYREHFATKSQLIRYLKRKGVDYKFRRL